MLVICNLGLLLALKPMFQNNYLFSLIPQRPIPDNANAISLLSFLVASLSFQMFRLDNLELFLTISSLPTTNWSLPNLLISFVNLPLHLFNDYLFIPIICEVLVLK